MVIDAMLLCFCHDCDINDGSVDRPFFASESLQVGACIFSHIPVGKGYTIWEVSSKITQNLVFNLISTH